MQYTRIDTISSIHIEHCGCCVYNVECAQCKLYRFTAYFTNSALQCSRCCRMHHISLRIGKQNDVASTLATTKTASCAPNRMLYCTRCDHTECQISFVSQQLYLQVMFLLLGIHSIYHSLHTRRCSFDSTIFKCRMILLLQNVTPNGVSFASIRMRTSIHFSSPSSSFSSSPSPSPSGCSCDRMSSIECFIFQFNSVRNSSARLIYSNMSDSIQFERLFLHRRCRVNIKQA